MLGLKARLRRWLFPEIEERVRELEKLGEVDAETLLAAEAVAIEFAQAVAKAQATPAEEHGEVIELDEGRVLVLIGSYRDCIIETGEIDEISFGGLNNVISNNLIGEPE